MEDEEEECCVPGLVDLPSKVRQISAGDSHTAAMTEDGHVYIWGKYIYINDLLCTLGCVTFV